MLDRVQPYQSLDELLKDCPTDEIIGNNLVIAWSKINSNKYQKIACSISGGSDSDILLDICYKCDKDKKILYYFCNTGMEYQATKDHLDFLEKKYGIKIERATSVLPVPLSCKKYGIPFVSKVASENIKRLQKHDFKWEDKPFEVLYEEYPRCKSALRWWCNKKHRSQNISYNKWLKEFLIQNPPNFPISGDCCEYSKKSPAHKMVKKAKVELNITGVRKAEGGARKDSYKSCMTERIGECDDYRPIFWYKKDNKKIYEKHFQIENSRCYTDYGLKRTGCACCPFGKDFELELQVAKEHEPKLYKLAHAVFWKSYEYTRKYREFAKTMDKREDEKKNGRQMEIFDYL